MGRGDVADRDRADEQLSGADLHVELARLALLIMHMPACGDGQAREASFRLIARFEAAAGAVLKRTAPASRGYVERRICEMVENSPVYASLQDTCDAPSLSISAQVDPAGGVTVLSVESTPDSPSAPAGL